MNYWKHSPKRAFRLQAGVKLLQKIAITLALRSSYAGLNYESTLKSPIVKNSAEKQYTDTPLPNKGGEWRGHHCCEPSTF